MDKVLEDYEFSSEAYSFMMSGDGSLPMVYWNPHSNELRLIMDGYSHVVLGKKKPKAKTLRLMNEHVVEWFKFCKGL